MTELGYPLCDDYHALDATGVSRTALTLRDGRRVLTNDGYVEPARRRPNIEVRGGVLVDRGLLDGRRAIGVRTAVGEEIAGRGVIVSAGHPASHLWPCRKRAKRHANDLVRSHRPR